MDAVEKIFAPALVNPVGGGNPSGVVSGEVNASVPTVANAGGATEERVKTPSMSALAEFVLKHMRINYDARSTSGVDDRLAYCLNAQTCNYTSEQMAKLAQIGIDRRVYSPLTATKVRAVYSMLMEISQYGSEIPFDLLPTPDPDVPEEVEAEVVQGVMSEVEQVLRAIESNGDPRFREQAVEMLRGMVAKAVVTRYDTVANAKDAYANKRAMRLKRKVWDTMVQGGYEAANQKCLEDFCTYGTSVMVGPVLRNVVRNRSVRDRKSGVRKIRRVIESIPVYERISPVDCYPSPDAEEITDGVLCVRVRYTKEELWRFRRGSSDRRVKGEEGWRDAAIARLLSDNEFGCRMNDFPADRRVENAELKVDDRVRICTFEGVRCFAHVDGRSLLSIGITHAPDGAKIDFDGFYYTETIVIGGMVVYCRIYDERTICPLSKSEFYHVPGSWWGESIADKLISVQTTMNNAVICLLRNMPTASSSMMWIRDASRLVDKSPSGLQADAGKIYAFTSSQMRQTSDGGVPMGVLQIPSNAGELLQVAGWATRQADIDSGIPAFAEGVGGSNGGALRTAEGLRTFTEHATRGVKTTARHYDAGMICGPARLTADWILVNDDDMDLKGDVEVRPVGLMGKILRAQNDQLRLQLFNMCLNSQTMQQILGMKGILALFRPSLRDTNINPDDVVPSKERMEFLEKVEDIKSLAQAAQAEQSMDRTAEGEGGGMQPGISPVEKPQGAVAARRGAA